MPRAFGQCSPQARMWAMTSLRSSLMARSGGVVYDAELLPQLVHLLLRHGQAELHLFSASDSQSCQVVNL